MTSKKFFFLFSKLANNKKMKNKKNRNLKIFSFKNIVKLN